MSMLSSSRWLKTVGFILLFSLTISALFINKHRWLGVELFFIPSISMSPSLIPGDLILVDTDAYQDNRPLEGDVIVFQQERQNIVLVKRNVAWPNGKTLQNQLYVMGDNRAYSTDSREFGGVSPANVIGKAKLILLNVDNELNINTERLLLTIQ